MSPSVRLWAQPEPKHTVPEGTSLHVWAARTHTLSTQTHLLQVCGKAEALSVSYTPLRGFTRVPVSPIHMPMGDGVPCGEPSGPRPQPRFHREQRPSNPTLSARGGPRFPSPVRRVAVAIYQGGVPSGQCHCRPPTWHHLPFPGARPAVGDSVPITI